MNLSYNHKNGKSSADFGLPNLCNNCLHNVCFVIHHGIYNDNGYYFLVECPNCKSCSVLFCKNHGPHNLVNLLPTKFNVEIPELIKELSPAFCEIYKQALNANALNLTELVGIGLGKAIEQLVYDYIKEIQHEEPKLNFNRNIQMLKGFDDAVVQLTLARFVRNDETHPQKESDFNVSDLIEAAKYLVIFFNAKLSTIKLAEKLSLQT